MDFRDLQTSATGSNMSSQSSFAINPYLIQELLNLSGNGIPNNPFNNIFSNIFSQMNNETTMYTYENMQIISDYLNNIIESENITEDLIRLVVRMWYNNSTGDFPTLEEIINYCYQRRCMCADAYNQQQFKELLEHYINVYGLVPTCQETSAIIEYRTLNREYPNLEQIEETMEKMVHLSVNPEDFHQTDKVLIGVKNLDKLPVLTMDKNEYKKDDDTNCSICQEEICDNIKYIKLNCGHMFHYDGKDCLDGASILNWFDKYKCCPNCKGTVEVTLNNIEQNDKESS